MTDKKALQGPVRIIDEKGVYPDTLDEAIREQARHYGIDISFLDAKTVIMKGRMTGNPPGILIIDEVSEYQHNPADMAMIERYVARKQAAQRKPQPKWAARNQAPRSPRK